MAKAHQRGAIPTPRHKLAAATPFVPPRTLFGIPAMGGWIPKKVSMWDNGVDGCCVTTTQAAVIASYPEAFVTDAVVKAWAIAHGVLNGAVIEDVLGWRTKDSMTADNGTAYLAGPYTAVDWTVPATLQAAILQGPVVLGVASSQLESAVNETNDASGWFLTGARTDENYDHCIPVLYYGTIAQCYAAIQSVNPSVVMPAAATAVQTQPGYVLFTWDSLGVADAPSFEAITGEAWLQSPSTIPGPSPVPTPTPTPTPPSPAVVTLPDGTYVITSTATGITFAPATVPPVNTVLSIVQNADGTGTLTASGNTLALTSAELKDVETFIADFTAAQATLGFSLPALLKLITDVLADLPTLIADVTAVLAGAKVVNPPPKTGD